MHSKKDSFYLQFFSFYLISIANLVILLLIANNLTIFLIPIKRFCAPITQNAYIISNM